MTKQGEGRKAERAGAAGVEAPQGGHGAPPPADAVQHPHPSALKNSIHPKRVALYLRVSTDMQTTDNQHNELLAFVERAGWQVTHTFEDHAISGAKGRDKRPGLDAMLKAATRREFDTLLVWSVDRIGRSLVDLINTLNTLREANRDLFILRQNVDTASPTGKMMFQLLGVFAEFEREMIRERTIAGMQRARAQGKCLGRPPIAPATDAAIRAELSKGTGILKTARLCGAATGTVQKIKREMTA